MKKQKTVIMLENIKENMLGEKHESLLDENKMLRELLKSALDENKKFCEDLELKQKEVDSYKKMNIEGKEEYGNLRKLYDGAKAERNEYFRMYSELLNENKDLKKSYENFVKAKNAQYLRKRKTSSQKDVDALNLKLEKAYWYSILAFSFLNNSAMPFRLGSVNSKVTRNAFSSSSTMPVTVSKTSFLPSCKE